MADQAPMSPRTQEKQESLGFFGSIWTHGWTPTNSNLLKDTEKIMLDGLKTPYEQFFVDAGENKINTVKLGTGPLLVMVHGYGGGVGLWIGNLDALAKHFTIYAIDLVGFGRSSHPKFAGNTHQEAQSFFLDSLEAWRQKLNLTNFHLFGHSLGAYLVGLYTAKFPQHVSHLILVDAWGVPQKPEGEDPRLKNATLGRKVLFQMAQVISSPFTLMRAAGPYGPKLVDWARPDLSNKFEHILEDKSVCSSYIYHCNVQEASGDMAFSNLQIPVGWARDPLVNYLPQLSDKIPVSMIYGKKTWMDINIALLIKDRMQAYVEIALIPEAGHHVYIDNQDCFNQAVILSQKQRLFDLSKVDGVDVYTNNNSRNSSNNS